MTERKTREGQRSTGERDLFPQLRAALSSG